jgi:cystathionine beta-lyase/cystathionine gamma-synthase
MEPPVVVRAIGSVETKPASLENAESALAFSSGMAAARDTIEDLNNALDYDG